MKQKPFANNLENCNPLFFLKRILAPEKKLINYALIYGAVISLLSLAIPLSVQSLINSISFTALVQPLLVLGFVLLILLISYGVFNIIQFYACEIFQRKFFSRFVFEIASNLINSDCKKIKQENLLEVTNRFFEMITVQKTIPKFITKTFAVILQSLLGLILIAFYHPILLVLSIFIIFSLYFICKIYFKQAASSAFYESAYKHELGYWLQDLSKNIPDFKLQKDNTTKDLNALTSKYLLQRKVHFKILFRKNILLFSLYAFVSSLLLTLGGFLILKSQLTLGQLVASEIVVSTVLYGISRLISDFESFYDLLAACEKLTNFYNIPQVEQKEKINLINHNKIDLPQKLKNLPKSIIWFLVIISLILAITPWQQTSKGFGQIIAANPNSRAQTINATVNGRISKWCVADGAKVKEGDKIVEIVDNDPLILERLKNEVDAKKRKQQIANSAAQTAKIDYLRQEDLFNKGLSSRKNFESAKIEYEKLLAASETALAEFNESQTKLSRQERQAITAPSDGVILKVLASNNSTVVKAGDKIATFAPNLDDMAIELYLGGNDIALIHDGRKVRLQFEGWPAVQFSGWPSVSVGTFGGVVTSVDSSISENGKFRVIVKKDQNESWPDARFLRHGTKVYGWVLLNNVILGYEIWRQANAFPPSFDDILKKDHGNEK